ncbi:DNA glycosylase [Tilletiaria anomala UBC 951]|uniref:DNA glycosylase n=1 Tax=Tilletiaria anomala (strain ATCC 24038 / CBS 436.72 / UBC 951) TaxID=1037660 RepID=A0A066W092_TILAU|nr:DNA glycosylase [Tilletiaria anomala UBC 951]KDN47352.1 DNA glycosylase [Tilletiaria anomala UBC 951]
MLEPRSTRSRTSSAADTAAVASSSKDSNLITDLHASPKKRSRIDAQPKLLSKGPRGKHAQAQAQARASDPELPPLLPPHLVSAYTTVAHPTLPFSLSTAIAHLRQTDARFDKLFALVPLRPFLELERSEVRELDLFKTLCTSILGQQISFLAARSVLYKFCRLFLMPEQPDYEAFPREKWPFPTPHEVLEASDDTLRGAGLSGQKVKYIRDVARRFADGRLDARKLIAIEEEEVVKELVQIKGVGLWTAEMLLMFALRRPNVLPVGDLGIQRGMLLFYLASAPKADEDGELMLAGVSVSERKQAPEKVAKRRQGEARCQDTSGPIPAASGLTPATLRARKDGKKVKGAYLTPEEMRALAQPWEPYRSIASFFMYALIDDAPSK